MVTAREFRLPFTPPTASEAEALARAAEYLLRAGTEVRTGLLSPARPPRQAWLQDLPGALLSAGHLCDAVAESAEQPRRSM